MEGQNDESSDNAAFQFNRKRVLSACDFCRYRHLKCDNQNPSCSNCTRFEQKCFYTQRTKRGPKRKNKTEHCDSSKHPPDEIEVKPNITNPLSVNIKQALVGLPNQPSSITFMSPALMEAFNRHVNPAYNGLYDPSLLSELQYGLEDNSKKFLFYSVLVNGAQWTNNSVLASKLCEEAESMLGGLLGTPSLHLGLGLILLGNYFCINSFNDRSLHYSMLANQVSQSVYRRIEKHERDNGISLEHFRRKERGLRIRSLIKIVQFCNDSDDREHYFRQARKLLPSSVESAFLYYSVIINTLRINDDTYVVTQEEFQQLFQYFSEVNLIIENGTAEDAIRRANGATDESWVWLMLRCLLTAAKSCLYWKLGDTSSAIKLAQNSWQMMQEEVESHAGIGFIAAYALLTKIFAMTRQTEFLPKGLKILTKLEPFGLIKGTTCYFDMLSKVPMCYDSLINLDPRNGGIMFPNDNVVAAFEEVQLPYDIVDPVGNNEGFGIDPTLLRLLNAP